MFHYPLRWSKCGGTGEEGVCYCCNVVIFCALNEKKKKKARAGHYGFELHVYSTVKVNTSQELRQKTSAVAFFWKFRSGKRGCWTLPQLKATLGVWCCCSVCWGYGQHRRNWRTDVSCLVYTWEFFRGTDVGIFVDAVFFCCADGLV